ncbi:enoyl-CoA hydratase-related protein [Maritimibacter sp.]|uniref:enoyl-CoA hydratase-related protein n=1 Tax=Maritimibacter sp. TaxID=2003363 RepID=UPI00257FFF90|nr:enoyl-CoA hydratase-related protein [Maritimibacter sp.]
MRSASSAKRTARELDTKIIRFVGVITLNRPEQRNSVNRALSDALRAAVKAVEVDPALRVTVLRGAGRVFCAGMDLKAFASREIEGVLDGEGGFAGFVRLDRTKPVIAAVHGAALAGGLEIMLACDMVIADRSTKFGLPEAKLGLLAGAGGVFRLAARIPVVKARELALTGRTFLAEEADRLGLLNRITEDGGAFDAAMVLADDIVKSAPRSVAAGLALSRYTELDDEGRAWVRNDALFADIFASDDALEGARSFAEKRAPVWVGH